MSTVQEADEPWVTVEQWDTVTSFLEEYADVDMMVDVEEETGDNDEHNEEENSIIAGGDKHCRGRNRGGSVL